MSFDHASEPEIALIVAAAENGVIGRGGVMPWRIPSDLNNFRRLTMAKPVIMGRKTYRSIGKPLPGRDNIVVTRDPAFRPDGVLVSINLEGALDVARHLAARRGGGEIMVIGGAEIYRQALPLADRVYLTVVHANPDGDAVFPPLDPLIWRIVRQAPIAPDPADEHPCTLMVYERVSPPPTTVAP
mgnify:CR=1 FL=1